MRLTINATVTLAGGQPLDNEIIMQALRGLQVEVAAGTVTFTDLAPYLVLCPENMDALRAVVTSDFSPNAVAAQVRGGVTVGDGVEGVFVWDNAWSGSDDGRDCIAPTYTGFTGSGRWRRITPPMDFYRQASTKTYAMALANGTSEDVALTSNAGTFEVSGPTADFSLGGLSGGTDGRTILLINATTYNMTLLDQSGGSSVGNRFKFDPSLVGNVVVAPFRSQRLSYSSSAGRWYRG